MKSLSLALVAALLLSSCTSDQVLTTLEAAVDAAAAYDLATRPQDSPYITLVYGCLNAAELTLEDGKTPAVQAAEISTECASAVAAGTGNVQFVAIANALQAFLRAIETTSAEIRLSHPELVNGFGGKTPGLHPLSLNKLHQIRAKIDKLRVKIRKFGKHLDIETGQWVPGVLP